MRMVAQRYAPALPNSQAPRQPSATETQIVHHRFINFYRFKDCTGSLV